MKVLQINSYSNGSTGTIAKSIHNALKKNGDESVFAYGIGNSSETDFKIGTELDFKLHTYGTLLTGLHGYFSKNNTKKLIDFIKKENPDIIHLHNIHGGYINLQVLFNFLKIYNKKVVITLHDCWLFTGKCYHFYEAGCEKWKEKCGNCPQTAMYPKSLFFDRTEKMLADKKVLLKDFPNLHVIAVSNWLGDVAKESFLGEYPISVIYNGVDTSFFFPQDTAEIENKYNLNGKFVILGVASSWSTDKGLQDFIKLSEKLQENEVIVLVGVTEEIKSNLPANCIGITRTENKTKLAKLYSRADVFVNFSAQETFGMVTAEAMACGTPVIVSSTTACPEIVCDGTGFVAEPHNIEQISNYIDKIRRRPRGYYRDACVTHVKKNYTVEKMTASYINLYKNMQ